MESGFMPKVEELAVALGCKVSFVCVIYLAYRESTFKACSIMWNVILERIKKRIGRMEEIIPF